MAADGDTLVAFTALRDHSGRGRSVTDLYVTEAADGERFGAARRMALDAYGAVAAIDVGGRAVVGGNVRVGSRLRPMIAVREPGGRWGALRRLPGGLLVEVIAVPGGGAVIFQQRYSSTGNDVRAREISPDGAIGPARDVGLDDLRFQRIAPGPDGTLAIAQGHGRAVHVVVRSPSGRWTRHRVRMGDVSEPHAAVGPDGRVGVVAIRPRFEGEDAAYGDVILTELAPRTRRQGPVHRAPVRAAGTRHAFAFGARLAFDTSGRRVVGWMEDATPDIRATLTVLPAAP